MKINPLPPLEDILKHLYLDISSPSGLKWRKNNKNAGTIRHNRWSILLKIQGKESRSYLAHRLIYFIIFQPDNMSEREIDHKNRNPLDNSIDNLRLVTRVENNQNKGIGKRNTSGVKGVSWSTRAQKWRAVIRANKVVYHLGSFENLDDAKAAYEKASILYHGEFKSIES
jgi:hypothetical protein